MSKTKIRLTSQHQREMRILQLALHGKELRREITPKDLERVPSLKPALKSLDAVLAELGWEGDQ